MSQTAAIFEDLYALQEIEGWDDAHIGTLIGKIARGDEVELDSEDGLDALYRVAWATHIRGVARGEAGIVMNAMQWEMVETGSMPLSEVQEYWELGEPGHHAWIALDGARANLGILWERSANALVEVIRYRGANLRVFVDMPLADFRAARAGESPDLAELSPYFEEASNRARMTLERGDLLADYLPPQNLEELLIRLDQLVSWNHWAGALDALEAYLESEHELDETWEALLRGLMEWNLGLEDEATARIAALDVDKVEGKAMNYLISIARDFSTAKPEMTVELLERVPEPTVEVLRDMAIARHGLDDADGALRDVERALELDEFHEQLHLLRARILFAMDRVDDALESYDAAIDSFPDYSVALSERGALHAEAGRHELAVADFEAALAIDPGYGPLRMSRARSLVELGRGLEALDDIEALAESEPYQDVLDLYAQLAEEASRTHSAATAYLKILRNAAEQNDVVDRALERLEALGYEGPITFPWPLSPSQQVERFYLQSLEPEVVEDFHYLREQVFHLNREQDYGRALQAAEELVGMLPDFFESWVTRGSVFLAAGYFEDALADAHEAMRRNERAESPYLLAHECYRALEQWADAAKAVEEAVERDPMSAQLRFAFAVSLEAAGDFDSAQEQLREALRLSPGLHDARFNLARLLDAAGEQRDALDLYSIILREAPDDAQTRVNAATAHFGLGEVDEAIELLIEAVELAPDYLFAHQKLALILSDVDPDRAAVHFGVAFSLAEELILQENEFRQRFDEMTKPGCGLDLDHLHQALRRLQDIGAYDEAHAAVSNLEPLGKSEAEYWLLRSEIASFATASDSMTDASHAARRAAALRDDDPRIHYQIAVTLQDEPESLLTHAERMIELGEALGGEDLSRKVDELVDRMADVGEFEPRAVAWLTEAERKLNGSHHQDRRLRLLFRRAWLRDRIGDRDGAIEDYSSCIDLDPSEATYWFNRACEYGIEGQASEAVADLREAITLDEGWRARAAEEEYFDPIRTDEAFLALLDG